MGRSKKEAEQQAAHEAYVRLSEHQEEPAPPAEPAEPRRTSPPSANAGTGGVPRKGA